ncbi:MAG TPA: hypothetical protein DCG19_14380, partial [Cryomorphaceae bacterium]|nr:hypothetical protein [Owenweeksia sp.]HAD98594.1 hypothetical protein [Cryomorphaceae bacterium]
MQILRKSLNLTFFIALTALGLHAQNPREELLGITSRPTPQGNSIENVKKKVTGLALPVSDDFSYAQKSSMPRPGLWLDSNVYV